MAIMSRFVRIWKADVNGVMDQLEDKGLLLKQCLRDMEEEIHVLDDKLAGLEAGQERVVREIGSCEADLTKLEEDLETALGKDKDDIARMLIKKIKPLARHIGILNTHLSGLKTETAKLKEIISARHLQFSQLQMKATDYWNRMEARKNQDVIAGVFAHAYDQGYELTDEEIELELIKRKDQAKPGKQGGREK